MIEAYVAERLPGRFLWTLWMDGRAVAQSLGVFDSREEAMADWMAVSERLNLVVKEDWTMLEERGGEGAKPRGAE